MTCEAAKMGTGFAFVCVRRRRRPRCKCGRPAPYLCDWKIGAGKTCDRPICKEHAREVGRDKHLCEEHQEAYDRWLASRSWPPLKVGGS